MSWPTMPLEQVLEFADPGVWGPADADDGVSVLRSTNFRSDGTFDLTNLALRAIPEVKRREKTLDPGDIVLERSGGSPRQPVGRVCYFRGDGNPHVFGNFCQRLKPDNKLIEPRFLFWHLYRLHMSGATLAYQKQTTGIRNLDYKAYLQHEVPVPPLPEQRRVVEILDQADHIRRIRTEAAAKAARILPAIFVKMFGHPATNSMEWDLVPFAEAFDDITSRCKKIQRKAYLAEGQLPVVDQGRELIAGYADATSLCCPETVPVIVFGDHTRVVKYVDFPFVAGADGSRVLRPKSGFCPAFAAVQLQLQPIPDLGYSRHMRAVRRLRFMAPKPELQEDFGRKHEFVRALTTGQRTSSVRLAELAKTLRIRALSGSLTKSWRQRRGTGRLREWESD